MKAPSGVAPEVLALPKGGGAVRSIGDTFSPDLHTGTGSYQVPLWFPRGPGGFQPKLALTYTSGAGNGAFGMGWRLQLPEIRRRTDRGLPSYDDAEDTFLLDGQEIVPVGGDVYRLRVEGEFRRSARAGAGWNVTDRGGRRFILGATAAARIEDTSGPVTRTLAWLLESATDRNGNQVRYSYLRDQGQLYLSRVAYGPYEIRLEYEARTDVGTDRRGGFPIGTGLRARRIEYRLPAEAAPLFRSYELSYEECPFSGLSLLASIVLQGYSGAQGSPPDTALPPLRFEYTPFTPKHFFQPIESPSREPPTGSLEQPGFDLVDMWGEGLAGVIQVDGPVRRYWPNRGGAWGPPRAIGSLPARLDLTDRGTAFADMNGDGAADIVLLADPPLGYLRNEPPQGWSAQVRFSRAPTFDPADSDVRLVDLNGDGLTDALRITTKAFYLYLNRGEAGWDLPIRVARESDPAAFPDVSFGDPRVKLADMTGDGLIDLVWVHGTRVDYWPNLGNGRFGPRQSLRLEPSVAAGFDPGRLFLADLNGDGISDVVYDEGGRVRFWINRSGRSLVHGGEVRYTPRTGASNARVADLLGSGTAGLVWSFPFSTADPNNYKYLGLAGEVRPYLLSRIDNGIGGITEVEYRPSTQHAVEAARRGTPWQSTLPFPVQTVSRLRQRDTVSGCVTAREIRYYDGWFDGATREFRGFGRAEVIEEGDGDSPSTRTTSYFHQGRGGVTPGATAEDRAALKGRLYRLEVFGPSPDGTLGTLLRREEDDFEVRELGLSSDGRRMLFPRLTAATVFTHEGQPTPLTDRTEVTYDDLGNIVVKDHRWTAGTGERRVIGRFRYTADTAAWILSLPVELVETDSVGTLLRQHRYFYDGPPFAGLPLGQVAQGNLSRREELVLTEAGAAAEYGAQLPDFAALGHHKVPVAGGGQGWAANGVRQEFDPRGNVVAQMDGFGNVGRVSYDAAGIFPTGVRDPLGHQFGSTYDLKAQEIVRISDPNGHDTLYRYDSSCRLRAMVKPGDSLAEPTVQFDYLDAALPMGVRTRLRDEAGMLDSVEYFDGLAQSIQNRSAAEDGQVHSTGSRAYNSRGWESMRAVPRLTAGFAYVAGEGLTDPRRYQLGYDALGRIVETTTPDGRTSRIEYRLGQIRRFDVSDTDNSAANVARGHFDTPRIEEYDARGRLLAVTETNSGGATLRTDYTLDALGRIAGITDPRNLAVARYTYDLVNRKMAVDHADAGRRLAVYDARGDLASRIDAEGQVVAMTYDELRRVTEVRANGVVVERHTYDAGSGANLVGRLARVVDEAGEVSFSYTPRGLIEGKTRTVTTLGGPDVFALGYTYDSMERLTSLTRPDGTVVPYSYNARGLTLAIPGVVDEFRWNAQGQVTEVRFVTGVVEHYSFDPGSFYLTAASVTGPARPQPYYAVTYTHDAVGNPLSITDQVTVPGHRAYSRSYSYDAAYRLTGIQGTLDGAPMARTYRYDDGGNFERNEEFAGDDLFLEPGSNRLAGAGATQLFSYDLNGNMTGAPNQTRTFDARGRLASVSRSDGTTVSFTYGYSGERVRKRVTSGAGAVETIYIDDVFEVRAGAARRFVSHQGRRIAEEAGGATSYLHPDHLGSVVLVTGAGGAIVREVGYLPFGTPAFSAGPAPSSQGFVARDLDSETGLVLCSARYYDPALGRFISPDPFLMLNPEKVLALPGSLNLYAYAANNPVRQVDADGTWWKWLVGALIIVALVAATIVVGVLTGGAGFAFGILLAASIGSGLGAGLGVAAAASAGGSLEDGFLMGAIVGGAAGAAGFAAGAAVGAAGISGVWGSILAGAAEGAVVGAGNGAIIGYGGGKGSTEDILKQMGIGLLVGAVLGGIAGWVKYNPDAISKSIADSTSKWSGSQVDPVTGVPSTGGYSTGPVVQSVGKAVGNVAQQIATATAYPVLYAGIGSYGQWAVVYHWDDIKSWILETFGGDDETVTVSVGG